MSYGGNWSVGTTVEVVDKVIQNDEGEEQKSSLLFPELIGVTGTVVSVYDARYSDNPENAIYIGVDFPNFGIRFLNARFLKEHNPCLPTSRTGSTCSTRSARRLIPTFNFVRGTAR